MIPIWLEKSENGEYPASRGPPRLEVTEAGVPAGHFDVARLITNPYERVESLH